MLFGSKDKKIEHAIEKKNPAGVIGFFEDKDENIRLMAIDAAGKIGGDDRFHKAKLTGDYGARHCERMGNHNLRGLYGNGPDGFEYLFKPSAVLSQKSREPFLGVPYIWISEDATELFVRSNSDKRKPGITNDILIIGMGYERDLSPERLQCARDTHKRMDIAGSSNSDNEIVRSGFGHGEQPSNECAREGEFDTHRARYAD